MAITIRNKRTEELIREIGRRYGEGPSTTIRRLAEKELAGGDTVRPEEYERSMKLWDDLMALAPPRDPSLTWEDLDKEMHSLFDYMEDEVEEARPR